MSTKDIHRMDIPMDGIVSYCRLAAVCGIPRKHVSAWIKREGLRHELRKSVPYVNLLDVAEWGHLRSEWLRGEIGKSGMLRLGVYLSRYAAVTS